MRVGRICLLFLSLALLAPGMGCATRRTPQPRAFAFGRDTFAFTNELTWEYFRDADGRWTSRKREPAPEYTLHCFPMVRACREFFLHASFAPEEPRLYPKEYRERVRQVIARSSRKSAQPGDRIEIPGYANLYSFSEEWADLLKAECGTATSSYFQRGHWRMIWPFSRHHQERTAEELLRALQMNWPPILHVVVFPKLTINHAVLVYDAEQTREGVRFLAYDPDEPAHPIPVCYDRKEREFLFPENSYFPGGRVNVYEVYCRWNY